MTDQTEEFMKLWTAFEPYPHLRRLIAYMAKQKEPAKVRECEAFFGELTAIVLILDADANLLDASMTLFRHFENGHPTDDHAKKIADLIAQHLAPKSPDAAAI